MAKEKLAPVKEKIFIKNFEVLNSGKLEEAIEDAEKKYGDKVTDLLILAMYDKRAGGLKLEGRKVAMGTFYNFDEGKPQEKVDMKNLIEDNYEDEYVLQPKKKKRPKEKDNLKRVKGRLARVSKSGLAPIKATSKKKTSKKDDE